MPCITIPSDDAAFREHVRRLSERFPGGGPEQLQQRLARLFPRVIVRARGLSSEPELWYVYRDGTWRSPTGEWWTAPNVPHLVADRDGWVIRANPAARTLLALGDGPPRHYSDLVASGAQDAATILYDVVLGGHPLSATLVLCPVGGDPIACEVRADRSAEGLEAWLRLADDIDPGPRPDHPARPRLVTEPPEDALFAAFAARQLDEAGDVSADALALRLRRLYPHARVTASGRGTWHVRRDGDASTDAGSGWWAEPGLPVVRFDDRGRILEANAAAEALLGPGLVGRHWHELVTPGAQDEVQPMLDLLVRVGEVVSRFRLPASDGRLVEFDSHTRREDGVLVTTMRPSDRDRR